VIGFDGHAIGDELNWQRRVSRQQFVHQALEVRRQVLDDDEGHPCIFGKAVEEPYEGVEAASRCSDTDYVSWRGVSAQPQILRVRRAREPNRVASQHSRNRPHKSRGAVANDVPA
jgi:hypothetical protein